MPMIELLPSHVLSADRWLVFVAGRGEYRLAVRAAV